jgi:hypothetical protein
MTVYRGSLEIKLNILDLIQKNKMKGKETRSSYLKRSANLSGKVFKKY